MGKVNKIERVNLEQDVFVIGLGCFDSRALYLNLTRVIDRVWIHQDLIFTRNKDQLVEDTNYLSFRFVVNQQ